MKKIIIILSFLFLSPQITETDYCKGFKKGYIEGYCYETPNCQKPLPPLCPIPTINCREGYKCGYNRGFLQGKKDRQ